VNFSPKDVAAIVARLEAQGVRQPAEVRAALAGADLTPEPKASRYGNVRCEVDGVTFDSLAERDRWLELRLLERAGAISDLRPSPEHPKKQRFVLGTGKRPPVYTPDFTYTEQGRRVVEDVKGAKRGGQGTQTDESTLRMKWFRERYSDIELRVVER